MTGLGITHHLSYPYSHQQMGAVERRHCHLVDTAITMLNFTSLPNNYWDYAILAACFLYNQNSSSSLEELSPLEALFGQKP